LGYLHIKLPDKGVTVMKKNMKIKQLITCMLASVLTISMLTGCQYRITDKTVEEEVAEALAEAEEQWKIEAQHKQDEAVAAALKSYEETQKKTDENKKRGGANDKK
jgi:hypothetical protein